LCDFYFQTDILSIRGARARPAHRRAGEVEQSSLLLGVTRAGAVAQSRCGPREAIRRR